MPEWPPLRDYSGSRAVLMGASEYSFLPDLPAALNSLERIAGLLTGPLCGWPADHLALLVNERGPGDLPDRLITSFEDAVEIALFYYVGHGQIDLANQLCLGLAGSRTEANRRAATSLPFEAVRRAMLDSPAAMKIVILDCCFAGLASLPTNSLAASPDDVLDRTAGSGAYTMAASAAYSPAWYDTTPGAARPQTFFTQYLVDLVEDGIPDQPSGLRLHPLFVRLRDRLASDERPVPVERSVDAARDFVFAHNAAPPEVQRDLDREVAELTQRLAEAEARRAVAEAARDQARLIGEAREQALHAEIAERTRELERLQEEAQNRPAMPARELEELDEAIGEAQRRLDETTAAHEAASTAAAAPDQAVRDAADAEVPSDVGDADLEQCARSGAGESARSEAIAPQQADLGSAIQDDGPRLDEVSPRSGMRFTARQSTGAPDQAPALAATATQPPVASSAAATGGSPPDGIGVPLAQHPRPITHRRDTTTMWIGRHRLPVIALACAITAGAVAFPFVLSNPPPSSPSSSSLSSSTPASLSSSSTAASGSNTIPSALSISSFSVNIASTMSQFKPLTQYATKGANTLQVGVILPDTTSSTRYVDFDAPYLRQSFTAAGYTSAQFRIDNAQGSDATELNDATADINLGAKILIMDPLDGPTGVAVAKLAESKGVTLISYDRATFQGTNTYYVSFNNELVGEMIGQGFESCVSAWGVSKPQVFVLNGGEDTDPNAISLATGYNKVVWGKAAKTVAAGTTNGKGYTLVSENFAPGWDNTKGETIFQQEYTAYPNINATIEANDGLANAVITVLKTAGVKPNTVPTTGQDATAQGMAWILQGYQCGSVYKAVYKEAQDAVSLATILLAGNAPPPALLNGTTTDPADSSIIEPTSLLTPVWVTKSNMESTVVKDGFDKASDICAIAGASVCSADGIK